MELYFSVIGALVMGIIAVSRSDWPENKKATVISLMVLLLVPACYLLYVAGLAY